MLKANELVLCMGVNQLRTPNIAMIAAACGFDAVYIDLEHNPTLLETAAGVCVAALGMGITPIARVTSHDLHDATRILDCGAQGVMIARCLCGHTRMRPVAARVNTTIGRCMALLGRGKTLSPMFEEFLFSDHVNRAISGNQRQVTTLRQWPVPCVDSG